MSQTMTANEVFMRRHRATSCARCMNSERALGKPGQEIGSRRTFRLLILQGILYRKRNFRSDCQKNSQIVGSESILRSLVHGKHAHHSIKPFERHRER